MISNKGQADDGNGESRYRVFTDMLLKDLDLRRTNSGLYEIGRRNIAVVREGSSLRLYGDRSLKNEVGLNNIDITRIPRYMGNLASRVVPGRAENKDIGNRPIR